MPIFGITKFADRQIEEYLEGLLEQSRIMADTIPDYGGRAFDSSDTTNFMDTFMTVPGLGMFSPWDMEKEIGTQRLADGLETTMVQTGWASGVELTYKMMKYIKFKERNSEATMLLDFAGRQTDNQVAFTWLMNQLFQQGPYWNLTDAAYLFGTHTLLTGQTFVNFTTKALTPTSLRTGLTQLMLTPDPQGNLMHLKPVELWVATGDRVNAIEVVNPGILYKPGSADYTTNAAVSQAIKQENIIECECIPSGAWMLFAEKKRRGLKRKVSEALHSWKYTWEPTRSVRFNAAFANSYGAKDWRGVYGSTGEG
jgi:hypothetical protein